MLINKCYITAKFVKYADKFVLITLKNANFLMYIGNFQNLDTIIRKILKYQRINAICRIRCVYEQDLISLNKKLKNTIWYDYFLQESESITKLVFLEAIKLNMLTKNDQFEAKGYFIIQDLASKIRQLVKINKKIKNCLITIRGNLKKSHQLHMHYIDDVQEHLHDLISQL